jgi:hypothetical protein
LVERGVVSESDNGEYAVNFERFREAVPEGHRQEYVEAYQARRTEIATRRVVTGAIQIAATIAPVLRMARPAAVAARGAGSATRASSAAQGALLRAQLAAEEVAGARLPQAITGYTGHGLNQAISRDGVGVSTRAIADAFRNPTSIAGQSGGRFVLTGRDAVVVVNAEGEVVTTWATNSAGFRVVQ